MSTFQKINIVLMSIIMGVLMTMTAAPLLADDIGGNNVKVRQSGAYQTAPEPSDQPAYLLENLKGFFDGWTVNINQSNPRVITISGKSMPIPGLSDISEKSLETAPEAVRNYLSAIIDFDLYGLEAASVKRHGKFTVVRFKQQHEGVRVESEGLKTVLNERGNLIFLKSDIYENYKTAILPLISSEQAVDIAFRDFAEIPADDKIEKSELVIFMANPIKPVLAYKIIGITENPDAAWKMYINAITGELISQTDMTQREEVSIEGHIYTEYKDWIDNDFVDVAGPMAEASYRVFYEKEVPSFGKGYDKKYTNVFFADEDGYYSSSEIEADRYFGGNYGIGNTLCSTLIQSPPESGIWKHPVEEPYQIHIDDSTDVTCDFDWGDYTEGNLEYQEGLHVAYHIWSMGQYFADLIGEGILGNDIRRITKVRDHTLGGFWGKVVEGKYIYINKFYPNDPLNCMLTTRHEMAHSVMYYNIGALPDFWSEGQATYYSYSYINQPHYDFDLAIYNENTRKLTQDSQYGHTYGHIIGGCWWDMRAYVGISATDALIYESAAFDISTLACAMQAILLADDDDGNLQNGTPNLTYIVDAFDNHWLGPEVPKIFFLDEDTLGHEPIIIINDQTEYDFSIYETYPWDNVVWDFDDGTPTQNGLSASHTYSSAGTYDLSCKAYYPWGMTEDIVTVLVDEKDEFTLSDNEGCSGAHFRIDVNLDNPLPADFISLPIKYDGDVDLVFDSVRQVGTRSEGLTVTLNTDIPSLFFRQYLIEGNGTIEELPAGDGVILELYFTAQGADYLEDETQIRVEEFGGIFAEVDHGSIELDLVTNPGSYTVTYFPGDANGDGGVNVGDAVYIINYLDDEDPGPAPDPIESADANCDGEVTIADASYIVAFVFSGGPAPECCDDNNPLKIAGDGTAAGLPGKYSLSQNYPNPFNPGTIIAYDLPDANHVKLEVINILGQRVVALVDKVQAAGHFEVMWDGKDQNGRTVASGIYFYRLQAGDFMASRKMILQK